MTARPQTADLPLFDACPTCGGLTAHWGPFCKESPTYEGRLDGPRLTTLLHAVRSLMADGRWRTLAEIHAVVGHSEAGISARLRELRNHWGCVVERKRIGTSGLWTYRLEVRHLKAQP